MQRYVFMVSADGDELAETRLREFLQDSAHHDYVKKGQIVLGTIGSITSTVAPASVEEDSALGHV